MENEFLQYEESYILKTLGFDLPCVMYFWDKTHKHPENIKPSEIPHWTPLHIQNHNELPTRVSRPTYSQAFRWFREKYGLYSIIHCPTNYAATFTITSFSQPSVFSDFYLKSYDEAEHACLNKLIQIIKDESNNN